MNLRREAQKFWKTLPAPPQLLTTVTTSGLPLRNPTILPFPTFDLMETSHAVASTGVAPITLITSVAMLVYWSEDLPS